MSTNAEDPNRPYPPGVAFDEAWRQSQRADKAELDLAELKSKVELVIRGIKESEPRIYFMDGHSMTGIEAWNSCLSTVSVMIRKAIQ
jgi:hypothetical protein